MIAVALVAPILLACMGAVGLLFLGGGFEGTVELLQEGGWSTWVSILFMAISSIGIAAAGFFIAKGRRMPLAIPAVLAALPWLVGLLGMMAGLSMVKAALAAVDPSMAGRLLAAGIGESFAARVVGAYGSAILFFGAAASFLAGGIAVAERRTTLLIGAGVAAAAGLVALADALAVHTISRVLTAVVSASPDQVATLIGAGVSDAALWKTAMTGALLLLGVATVAYVVTAFAARSSAADAIATALIIFGLIGFDALSASMARKATEDLQAQPLAEIAGFEPSPAPRSDAGGRVDLVVKRGQSDLGQAAEQRGVALDRRLPAPEVARVVEELQKGGTKEVELFGETRALSDELMRALGDDAAYFRGLAHRRSSVRVGIGSADGIDDPLTAEIDGSGKLSLKSKEGAPIEIPIDQDSPTTEGASRIVLLIVTSSATADDLVRSTDALALRDYRPVLVRELPEVIEAEEEPPPPASHLPRVPGTMDPDLIRKVIQRNLVRAKLCYESRLGSNPRLQGKVTVSMTIEANGRVSAASVRDTTLGDRQVEACIVRTVKSLRFPRPRGGYVEVNYPFLFLPH